MDGTWIFDGMEVLDITKYFFVPVTNRSSETLLEIIEKYIAPRTTIISDCWKAIPLSTIIRIISISIYHLFYNFVNLNAGATTNHMERLSIVLQNIFAGVNIFVSI